jgi:CubicO group peptidase (beta-lactamase class C family)
MDPSPFLSSPFSRRRVLSLAAAATTLAVTAAPTRRMATQVTPIASPVATPPTAGTPVAGAATAAPLPLASTLAADASPEFRTIVEALVAAMEANQVPGAAIGLMADDREEHATVGLASLSSMRPVTPETLFQIGSLTKTYTSTAIWHLIDAGALAFDAPVRTYIPELTLADETVAAEVTVANLLDHSAGWYGDEGFETGDDDGAIARYVAERLPQLPQVFPLGAFFSYNNACFTLLGRLIEVATGPSYNAAMANLLLGPLGLNDSLLDHAAVLHRPFAEGHVAMPINGHPALAVQTPLWVPRSVDPAGGIWATTRDVLRYGRFHLETGTITGAANIVSPGSLRQMREPVIAVPGTDLQMGRDWFVQDIGGTRVFFHGGDTNGQHTDFVAIPDQRFALAVLTNAQGGGGPAALAALDTALAQFPALAPLAGTIGLIPALQVPADTLTVSLPADELAAYAGRYADPGTVISLPQQGEGLELSIEPLDPPGAYQATIQPPTAPPAPVVFLAKDMAVVNGTRVPFVRDAAGHVQWVSLGLRLVPRVEVRA